MKTQIAFEFDEQDYSPELVEAMDDYIDLKEQEGPVSQLVTADELSKELKEAMGLDILPDDIQNDILILSQKIVNHVVELLEELEQESPYLSPQSRAGELALRYVNCLKNEPSREIFRDAWRAGSMVGAATKFAPPAIRTWGPPAAILGGLVGGSIGSMVGCMTNRSAFGPRPVMRR